LSKAIRDRLEDDALVLERVLDGLELSVGEDVVWIVAEAATAREIRACIVARSGNVDRVNLHFPGKARKRRSRRPRRR